MNNNNGNNGFFSGFLLGAVIGGAAVFFLGTKKGKQLLKTVSEEGLDGISDLVEIMEEEVEGEEELSASKVTSTPATGEAKPQAHANGETKKSPIRRFFKGIPRRG